MTEYEKWREVAKKNGIKTFTFRERVRKGWSLEEAATLPKGTHLKKKDEEAKKDVAMYQGDSFLIWGSIEEVAEKLGKTEREIKVLCAPSMRNRLEQRRNAIYGIYIEDDEHATSY